MNWQTLNYLHQSPIRTILYCKWLSLVDILLAGRRTRRVLWWSQTGTTLQDPNRRSSRSASPIHLSTGRNKVFASSHSNVRVVRSITRFDGRSLSYVLVRSNCNKLVITWPLGRLADLSPSWQCYNYNLYNTASCPSFVYMHNNSQHFLKARASLGDVQRRTPHLSWHSMPSSGVVQTSCTLTDQPAIIKCQW